MAQGRVVVGGGGVGGTGPGSGGGGGVGGTGPGGGRESGGVGGTVPGGGGGGGGVSKGSSIKAVKLITWSSRTSREIMTHFFINVIYVITPPYIAGID